MQGYGEKYVNSLTSHYHVECEKCTMFNATLHKKQESSLDGKKSCKNDLINDSHNLSWLTSKLCSLVFAGSQKNVEKNWAFFSLRESDIARAKSLKLVSGD